VGNHDERHHTPGDAELDQLQLEENVAISPVCTAKRLQRATFTLPACKKRTKEEVLTMQ
jgi:hypothetical protein